MPPPKREHERSNYLGQILLGVEVSLVIGLGRLFWAMMHHFLWWQPIVASATVLLIALGGMALWSFAK